MAPTADGSEAQGWRLACGSQKAFPTLMILWFCDFLGQADEKYHSWGYLIQADESVAKSQFCPNFAWSAYRQMDRDVAEHTLSILSPTQAQVLGPPESTA